MIQEQFLPFDEVQAFAFTWHGLAEGGQYSPTITINGVRRPLPFDAPIGDGDTHLLRVPGIGPVPLTPEQLAAEAAEGRVWQNYALISGANLSLFGRSLGGWVCIDPAGARWLVRGIGATNVQSGQVLNGESSASFRFSVVPFGYLNEPAAAPTELECELADIGQSADSSIVIADGYPLRLGISSISSDGRRVVVYIHFKTPGAPSDTARNMFPIGYLMLTLEGDGPNFTPTMEVLYPREQCLAKPVNEGTPPTGAVWQFAEESDGFEEIPPGSGYWFERIRRVGIDYLDPQGGPSNVELGTGSYSSSYRGRIITVVFDENDILKTFRLDCVAACSYNLPEFDFSSEGVIYRPSNPASNLTWQLSRTISSQTERHFIIRIDDQEVERISWVQQQSQYRQSGTGGTQNDPVQSTRSLTIRGYGTLNDSTSSAAGGPTAVATSPPLDSLLVPSLFNGTWRFSMHGGLEGWPEARLAVVRGCNQVVEVYVTLADESQEVDRYATYAVRVIATGATWDGDGHQEEYVRRSTYEPMRRELFTTDGPDFRTPCWI